MSNSTEQLKNALKQYEPAETIFVSASRAFGRRVLTTLARETMLVGVRAETPLTLAVELCADASCRRARLPFYRRSGGGGTRFSMYEDQPAFWQGKGILPCNGKRIVRRIR